MSFDDFNTLLGDHPTSMGHFSSFDSTIHSDTYPLDFQHSESFVINQNNVDKQEIMISKPNVINVNIQRQLLVSKIEETRMKLSQLEELQNHITYALSELQSLQISQSNDNNIVQSYHPHQRKIKSNNNKIVDTIGFPYPITCKDTIFRLDNSICSSISNLIKSYYEDNIINKNDPLSVKVWSENDNKLLYTSIQNDIYIYYQSILNEYESKKMYNTIYNKEQYSESFINSIKSKKTISSITYSDIIENINNISWKTISKKIGHSSSDCLCHWLNYCDTKINHNKWSLDEDKQLFQLVNEYNERDWITIASIMNTGRTPFMCLEHYQMCYNTSLANDKWSNEEDELLMNAISQYGHKNWHKIATCVPSRSFIQCRSRYHQVLRNQSRRLGRWSNIENMSLIVAKYYVENDINSQNTQTTWNIISNYIKTRTSTQCRERWENILKPNINHSTWTIDEDELLLKLIGNNKTIRWANIANVLKNRTDAQCKIRYHILLKLKSNQIIKKNEKKTKRLIKKKKKEE